MRDERVVEEQLLDSGLENSGLRPTAGRVLSLARHEPGTGVPSATFRADGIDWLETGPSEPSGVAGFAQARLALLAEQRSRLAARVAGLQGEVDRRERSYRSRIAALRIQIEELKAQLKRLRDRQHVRQPGGPEVRAGSSKNEDLATECRRGRVRRQLISIGSRVGEWSLNGDRSTVGRGMEADIRLDDPTVSRLHGVLYCEGGALIVEDARSAHGVFVNGERVQQAVLKDGDVIAFGDVAFSLRVLRPRDTTAR